MPPSAEVVRHAAEFTEATGLDVLLEEEAGRLLVLIASAPLPPGSFSLSSSDLLFVTDAQYPLSALDMFWTEPGVLRPNGDVPAGADSLEVYLGRQWRRFSWHRNGLWNPARNGLLDHYEFVQDRFTVERAA